MSFVEVQREYIAQPYSSERLYPFLQLHCWQTVNDSLFARHVRPFPVFCGCVMTKVLGCQKSTLCVDGNPFQEETLECITNLLPPTSFSLTIFSK